MLNIPAPTPPPNRTCPQCNIPLSNMNYNKMCFVCTAMARAVDSPYWDRIGEIEAVERAYKRRLIEGDDYARS